MTAAKFILVFLALSGLHAKAEEDQCPGLWLLRRCSLLSDLDLLPAFVVRARVDPSATASASRAAVSAALAAVAADPTDDLFWCRFDKGTDQFVLISENSFGGHNTDAEGSALDSWSWLAEDYTYDHDGDCARYRVTISSDGGGASGGYGAVAMERDGRTGDFYIYFLGFSDPGAPDEWDKRVPTHARSDAEIVACLVASRLDGDEDHERVKRCRKLAKEQD